MTVVEVEGPAWTGFGLTESAGRYPLRVEGAVGQVVGRLLPGVITTTRHARMYCLHTLARAEAQQKHMSEEESDELVRRCEVVIAAIHHFHRPHRVSLSVAHGEERLPFFVRDDDLDVAAAAVLRTGLSMRGFANVYQGPCVRLGALSPDRPPQAGSRADLGAIRQSLGELTELATHDSVAIGQIRAAGHLCLCQTLDSGDGRWLRRILVDEPEQGHLEDRYRQLTCLLLLDTLHDQPTANPLKAFSERWAFGELLGDPQASERALVTSMWRAAALRNYSVGAWRWLWRWLAGQLSAEPMTAEELGEQLANTLEDITVAALLDSLPPRTDGEVLLPAEVEIASESWTPMTAIRQLALGAGRLDDLDQTTLKAFVGTDTTDLGPRWVADLLAEWHKRSVRSLARELAVMLVRRAKRVALSKMYLTNSGEPFVPTRLRDRDGILSIRGQEGAGDVALRIDQLAEILAELGVLGLDANGALKPTPEGEELRARIA